MINRNGKMVFTEEEREDLATNNMKLIHKVAHNFQRTTNMEYHDIFGVAQIGFVNALNTYNPDKATKFTTYAVTCMQKQILFYLRGELKRNKQKFTSFDEVFSMKSDGNEINKSDLLMFKEILHKGDELNCIEAGYQKTELEEYLKKEFENMDKTYAQILILRFGLFSTPEYTQAEIAEMLKSSQSNISKMEKKALEQFGRSAFLEYCGLTAN